MKIYVISDIHGKTQELESFVNYIKKDDFDYLIVLGDIYRGYDYTTIEDVFKIGNILSEVVTKLIIIKGNCDIRDDEKFLPVGFKDNFSLMINSHHIYFTHGHHYFPFGILKENDIYCHGHTHINKIEKVKHWIECSPGSISMPRAKTKKSYLVIDNDFITIYDLNHEIIKQIKSPTN